MAADVRQIWLCSFRSIAGYVTETKSQRWHAAADVCSNLNFLNFKLQRNLTVPA